MPGTWRYCEHSAADRFPLPFDSPTQDKSSPYSQTFHNYFLKEIETASAFTKLDADMRKELRLISAASIAIASFSLSGCGADDSASVSSSPTVSNNQAAQNATPDTATGVPSASSPLAANPVAASDPAADPIVQSMQASLAADNRQVAPLMHYAPGDSGND